MPFPLLEYTSPLFKYASPPTNYIGTLLFLSYIFLALYATLSICYSLYTQYTSIFHPVSPPPNNHESLQAARTARARHIKIYAFLASLSFAALSYHMLMFLVGNYLQWSGSGEGLGEEVGAGSLWKWMLNSTLFQDFARELVRDRQSALWTQVAVLGTWFWNVWVGRKAIQRNFDPSTMRTYILLSQILPISFVAALFIIRLHLSHPDIQPRSSEKPATTSDQKLAVPTKPIASLHLPSILLNALLLSLPSLSTHPTFISLVLFSRLILLLPYTGWLKLRLADVSKCMYIASGFVGANAWRGRRDVGMGDVVGVLVRGGGMGGDGGGYAVRALGWDAVLGGVVAGVLSWGGGV